MNSFWDLIKEDRLIRKKQRDKLYHSAAWKRLRKAVLHRDGYECKRCGSKLKLEVHHIKKMIDGGEPMDMNNLMVLCKLCHFKADDISKNRVQHAEGFKEWRKKI